MFELGVMKSFFSPLQAARRMRERIRMYAGSFVICTEYTKTQWAMGGGP
jgi:hypothetical protein